MAVNEQVDAYLRNLYERSINPPDAMPGEEAVEPFTYGTAGAERPRFAPIPPEESEDVPLVNLVTGEEIPAGATLQDIRNMVERRRPGAQEQPVPAPPEGDLASYLSALRAAQRQDEIAALAARTMAPAEEIARIQSRGLYRPSGVPGLPSAVADVERRQKAVQDYLAQQRAEQRAREDVEYKRALTARMARLAPPGKSEEELELLSEKAETERAKQKKLEREAVKPPPATRGAKPGTAKEEKLDPAATKLRNEFAKLQEVKDYNLSDGYYRRMLQSVKSPSAAGDITLVFNFMKLNDPGSTVREGEQAQASNAAGVPERVRNLYNSLLTGERLSVEQRQDLLSQGLSSRNVAADKLNEQADFYTALAERANIKIEDVLRRATIEQPQTQQAAPQPRPGPQLTEEEKAELERLRRRKAEGKQGT